MTLKKIFEEYPRLLYVVTFFLGIVIGVVVFVLCTMSPPKTEAEQKYEEAQLYTLTQKELRLGNAILNDEILRRAQIEKEAAELMVATAEARGKAVVLDATRQAEANRILQTTLTSEILEYKKLSVWDGHLPSIYYDAKSEDVK